MQVAFRQERFVEKDSNKGIIQLGSTRPTKIDYQFKLLKEEKNIVLKKA